MKNNFGYVSVFVKFMMKKNYLGCLGILNLKQKKFSCFMTHNVAVILYRVSRLQDQHKQLVLRSGRKLKIDISTFRVIILDVISKLNITDDGSAKRINELTADLIVTQICSYIFDINMAAIPTLFLSFFFISRSNQVIHIRHRIIK